MKTISAVLDCDPGHDDVVAILMAARHMDLVAVTTVAGNASLENTTRNALMVVELFGVDVRVHAGADRPLLVANQYAETIHGTTGLDGPPHRPVTGMPGPASAVERLLAFSRDVSAPWIVATGPLTNVALALRADPALAERLAGLSVMGGGLQFGNVTPAAEFNFWADPDAAAIVFDAGVPITLCPLDLTHQLLVDRPFAERVRSLGTEVATFMAELFGEFIRRYDAVSAGAPGGPMHDPCAVLALTHPELFIFESLALAVVPGEGRGRGAVIVDRRNLTRRKPHNARVATTIDADAARELIYTAIAAVGRATAPGAPDPT